MKKRLRTIQPAHESDKFTVEEAMEAWRRVEAEMASERARKRRNGGVGASPRVLAKTPVVSSVKVAADRDQ